MPDAVILTVRCLEPGCDMGEHKSSVGMGMSDAERLDCAEAFVQFSARWCRDRHDAGVEARFSDQPARRLLLSHNARRWDP